MYVCMYVGGECENSSSGEISSKQKREVRADECEDDEL